MRFPKTTGVIKHVDRQHYDDLIGTYVDRVSKLEGVLGVVLFGSVTTPGLSDVDLVVTVSDKGPWPAWEDISLRRIAKGHPAESVVAHDVFVWPEKVAKKAESLFYVDQQTVLFGAPLGGNYSPALNHSFHQLLSMDYLINRFESLSALLISPQVNLRSVLLFISTLRHTSHLAAGLGLIPQTASAEMVNDINTLRQVVIEKGCTEELLEGWPERIVMLLWSVTLALASQLELDKSVVAVRKWYPSKRQAFLNSDSTNGVDEWKKCIDRQANQWITKYVRAAPVPSPTYAHVQNYFEKDTLSGNYLSQNYPAIFSGDCQPSLNSNARNIRVETVIEHWQFLIESGYMLSSGKGYIGVGIPSPGSTKVKLIKKLNVINTLRLPKMSNAKKNL